MCAHPLEKFLIITQVFRPDPAAVGQYLDEAAQAIAETGAEVTILQPIAAMMISGKVASREVTMDTNPAPTLFLFVRQASRFVFLPSFPLVSILRGLFARKLTDLLLSASPPMAGITAVIIGFFAPS